MNARTTYPTMTSEEFRERIREICGLPPTGYYVQPVKPNPCLRTHTTQKPGKNKAQ